MSEKEKLRWKLKSELIKEQHLSAHPDYKYKPRRATKTGDAGASTVGEISNKCMEKQYRSAVEETMANLREETSAALERQTRLGWRSATRWLRLVASGS